MLCAFKEQGGTVIFTEEIPEYINGIKCGKVIDLAKKCIVTNIDHIAENIPESCRLISLDIGEESERQFIRTTVRNFGDMGMTMYYICNFS